MDANGLKFWLLADEHHWYLPGNPPALEYDVQRRSLRLSRQRRELHLIEDTENAENRLQTVPQTRDSHGNRAWYDAPLRRILAAGVSDAPQNIYSIDAEGELTDLALADDGVLYLAVGGIVIMHDRRQRWTDTVVSATGFNAWRLSPAPGGGVWVLDRDNRQLARLRGYPVSDRAYKPYAADVVRPCNENTNPPRLDILPAVNWPELETPVALACSLSGELVCLSWISDGEALLRQLSDQSELSDPMTLLGTISPYSIAWVASGRVAVLVCGETTDDTPAEPKSEARVYTMTAGLQRHPSGDIYPLKRDYNFGPFMHGLDYPPHYPTFTGSHALHRLSFPLFTRQGEAYNAGLNTQLDSGEVDAVWHRLNIEASIPNGCGIRVWLAASNSLEQHIDGDKLAWFEHRFGDRYRQGRRSEIPVGAWSSLPSELPHHPGLMPCQLEAEHKGLFSVLIQRTGLKVRNMRGRYLYVRTEMTGSGNATPELFALRAYASRFSFVEHYLPKLYWETTFSPEADLEGDATPADFLERFIGNIEGLMTSIEDRVAYSDLVTRPQTVPTQALEWLADWVGFQFEPGWSEFQRRCFLEQSAELYRWHGTLRGLNLALEIATQGGVSGGEVLVLEDYRLRRTFATILGANLDDDQDPLTLGGIETGNSFVGDTLFLGDELQREFLALFSADLEVNAEEKAAIDAFFERLAFRITILVRQNLGLEALGMIQRIAEREVPVHVQYRILTTSAPLLAGITSLVGVDTYLTKRPPPRIARVDESHVGRGDYVMGPAVLDPRLEGIGSGRSVLPERTPIARASDVTVAVGESIVLDGSASEAAEGREVTAYHWTYLE